MIQIEIDYHTKKMERVIKRGAIFFGFVCVLIICFFFSIEEAR